MNESIECHGPGDGAPCGKPRYVASGLCRGHYAQERKGRDLTPLLRQAIKPRCHVNGCARQVSSKGVCSGHYQQMRKGKPFSPISARLGAARGLSLADKIAHYSANPDGNGCMMWQGKRNQFGYGVVYMPATGRVAVAHRVAYEVHTGAPVPIGLTIHHICANRACVAPEHLQPVTQRENTAEMFERNYYIARIAELESQLASALQVAA